MSQEAWDGRSIRRAVYFGEPETTQEMLDQEIAERMMKGGIRLTNGTGC